MKVSSHRQCYRMTHKSWFFFLSLLAWYLWDWFSPLQKRVFKAVLGLVEKMTTRWILPLAGATLNRGDTIDFCVFQNIPWRTYQRNRRKLDSDWLRNFKIKTTYRNASELWMTESKWGWKKVYFPPSWWEDFKKYLFFLWLYRTLQSPAAAQRTNKITVRQRVGFKGRTNVVRT